MFGTYLLWHSIFYRLCAIFHSWPIFCKFFSFECCCCYFSVYLFLNEFPLKCLIRMFSCKIPMYTYLGMCVCGLVNVVRSVYTKASIVTHRYFYFCVRYIYRVLFHFTFFSFFIGIDTCRNLTTNEGHYNDRC